MGAYGNPDAAIAGMIVGVPNVVESAIAKEDIAYGNCQIMMQHLNKAGIKFEYFDSKAGGHTWPVWREDLYLFAQKIFK